MDRAKLLALSTLVLTLLLGGCKLATIRPLDPKTGKAIIGNEEQAFSAERYVAERWQDPLLIKVEQAGVELGELLTALQTDSAKASETYGRREGNSPYSFIVKGRGRVLELDTSSRAGLLKIDLEPFDGQADLSLAMGPVIKGTALRDAMPFIKFNDFTNQLEFADVSKALHARVMTELIEPFDVEASIGKTLQFSGAFTLADPIVITPVKLEVTN